jgi:hypothetical protein
MFSIDTTLPGLAVVTFRGAPSEAAWPGYAVAYARLLRDAALKGPRLVVVFDLRELTWDLGAVSQFAVKKTALTAALKPWTLRAMQAAVVLTASPALASVVTTIVKATGQSAPFFCVGSVAGVARLARTLVPLALGSLAQYAPPARDGEGEPDAAQVLPWTALPHEAATGVMVVQLVRLAPGLLQAPPATSVRSAT